MLAETIKDAKSVEAGIEGIASLNRLAFRLSDKLAQDNGAFDRGRFITACGFENRPGDDV